MPTAAVIIIGDEILSGKFADANSPWLASRCREIGLDLIRIAVIPDDIGVIAHEVCHCSERVDHVFTTGGVGPTHDDVTMEAIAKAFDLRLERNAELEKILRDKMGEAVTDEALGMTDLPTGAELWWDGRLFFPVIVVRNVCIFPGVPSLLQRKFDEVAHRFEGTPMASRRVTTHQRESQIACILQDAQDRWGDVSIGSYPRFEEKPYTVIVTMDGRNPDTLDECEAHLRESLDILD